MYNIYELLLIIMSVEKPGKKINYSITMGSIHIIHTNDRLLHTQTSSDLKVRINCLNTTPEK